MPENDFEKQIKQLMDEFKISPSESVWEKVKQHLYKSRRRRVWLLVPLLLLCLSVAVYFLYKDSSHVAKDAEQIDLTDTLQKAPLTADKSLKENKEIIKETDSVAGLMRNNNTEKKSDTQPENILSKNNPVIANDAGNMFSNDSDSRIQKIFFPPAEITEIQQKNYYQNFPTTKLFDSIKNYQNVTWNEQIKFITDTMVKKHLSQSKQDSLHEQAKKSTNIFSENDSTRQQGKVKNNAAKKLQWGVGAFYGRADVKKNLLGVELSDDTRLDAVFAPAGYPSRVSNVTEEILSSSAFKVGFFVQKPISKRHSISLGLNYMHLNTRLRTGIFVDSVRNVITPQYSAGVAINAYYRQGKIQTNTNAYHFIEIPLLFQHRFINSKKIPISYNAGVSYAQLFSARALVYDAYNDIYYNDNNILNKPQLQIQIGLGTQLNLIKNISLSLSPQMQYSLSNLVRNKTYGNQHLFNWGLQVNLIHDKK